MQYKGFISYSQKDRSIARTLQKRLESFRLSAAQSSENNGRRKIGKFFRDETDLSGSASLTDALTENLQASEFLIVICSPQSAQSKWVDEEIRNFRSSGRGSNVLAIIAEGIPNDPDPNINCFSPAFGQMEQEPIGLNAKKDGWDRTVCRLVAELVSVSFDDIWRRDLRQRNRRRGFLFSSVIASLALIATSVGGLYLNAKNADKAKRNELVATRLLLEAERFGSDRSRLLAREAEAIASPASLSHANAILLALYGLQIKSPYYAGDVNTTYAHEALTNLIKDWNIRYVLFEKKLIPQPFSFAMLEGDNRIFTSEVNLENTSTVLTYSIYDLEADTITSESVLVSARITATAVSPLGNYIAIGVKDGVEIWTTGPLQKSHFIPTDENVQHLIFSQDEQSLAYIENGYKLNVWSVPQKAHKLHQHSLVFLDIFRNSVSSIAISHDGRFVFTALYDGNDGVETDVINNRDTYRIRDSTVSLLNASYINADGKLAIVDDTNEYAVDRRSGTLSPRGQTPNDLSTREGWIVDWENAKLIVRMAHSDQNNLYNQPIDDIVETACYRLRMTSSPKNLRLDDLTEYPMLDGFLVRNEKTFFDRAEHSDNLRSPCPQLDDNGAKTTGAKE